MSSFKPASIVIQTRENIYQYHCNRSDWPDQTVQTQNERHKERGLIADFQQ